MPSIEVGNGIITEAYRIKDYNLSEIFVKAKGTPLEKNKTWLVCDYEVRLSVDDNHKASEVFCVVPTDKDQKIHSIWKPEFLGAEVLASVVLEYNQKDISWKVDISSNEPRVILSRIVQDIIDIEPCLCKKLGEIIYEDAKKVFDCYDDLED